MKHIVSIIILSLPLFTFGQQNLMSNEWENNVFNDPNLIEHNFKDSLSSHNFSSIWTTTKNEFIFGFIGGNFQRIRIKFISVQQDSLNQDTYNVIGKSMVQNNLCDFSGTITIERIALSKGITEEYASRGAQRQGFLTANYYFQEDSTQKDAGIFEGSLTSLWFIDQKNRIHYDDVILGADAFRNNQFKGTWTSYTNGKVLTCNWGDYRILNCGNLDVGAGQFSPSDPYLKYGWQGYRDAYFRNNDEAYALETHEWWK